MVTGERVTALRHALAGLGVDGFIVPRADEHLGEYVPPGAERLAWLTGFTGSAGLAIVALTEAAVFTDGRYVLQLDVQTDGSVFQRLHLTQTPPQEWAASRIKRLGYDPWLLSHDGVKRYTEAGITLVPLTPNPIDAIWVARPPAPSAAAVPHGLALAGEASAAKREAIAATLRSAGQDACVLTDPPSINWLLNLRGGDVAFTPVALAFAILHADGRADLFIDPAKIGAETRQWLGNQVACQPPAAFVPAMAGLAGRTVRVDAAGSPAAVGQILRDAGAVVVDGGNPCLLPKACKNPVEQAGARAAHRRDGVAVCRFLRWLETAQGETEMSAANQLLAFRREVPGFRDESFPAISGAGEHGAVIHYRVTAESDRTVRPSEVYLIDSGGQYEDGTTDITRTVWTGPGTPPAELRARFTQVLRGNIALALTVFPHGVAGPHLDALARRPLWGMGLDYDHGTGHGVGKLSVGARGAGQRIARRVDLGADRGGDDPVQRTRLLRAWGIRDPAGNAAPRAARGFRRQEAVPAVRGADAGPVRPPPDRPGPAGPGRARLAGRLPRPRRLRTIGRKARTERLARRRLPPDRTVVWASAHHSRMMQKAGTLNGIPAACTMRYAATASALAGRTPRMCAMA